MDVYRPSGSGILVYYKLLSDTDPANFDDNNYNLMTELSSSLNLISRFRNDYFEATYAPGTYGSGVETNIVNYTSAATGETKNDFSLYSIKIVMYGTSTVDVPKISQLRVLALPSYTPIQ
jgi:hypothetical protein